MMLPLLVDRRKTLQVSLIVFFLLGEREGAHPLFFQVYAPAEAVPFIKAYITAMNRLNQQSSDWEDRHGACRPRCPHHHSLTGVCNL